MFRLQSMLEFYDVQSVDDLGPLIVRLTLQDGTGAFWLHRDGVCELALFLNGPHAVVYRDTDCAWSFSPDASEGVSEQFTLENGQIDDFSLPQCVAAEDGIAAFLETAATGDLSARIAWH